MRFWDSSALIAIVLRETATMRLLPILQQETEVAVWWGSRVECASALARVARSGAISQLEELAARQRLTALWEWAFEVGPADELRERAIRLVAVHHLRAADALQLAAALDWYEERPTGKGFVCLDSRLRAAALREGFDIFPPPEEVHEAAELAF